MATTPAVMDPELGRNTSNPDDMHRILRNAWDPIFQYYRDKPMPKWEALRAQYPHETGHARVPISLPSLDPSASKQ